MSVKDPACGMEVDTESAAFKEQHQGKDYYFCSQACTDHFVAEPDKYAETEQDKHNQSRQL